MARLEIFRASKSTDRYEFAWGVQAYKVRIGDSEYGMFEIDWTRSFVRRLIELYSRDVEPGVAEKFGDELRDMLAPVWSAVRAMLGDEERVELTISSEAAQLYMLPFELLREKTGGTPLGLEPRISVRYQWLGRRAARAEGGGERGRLLVAWAAPKHDVPHAEHIRELVAADVPWSFNPDPEVDVVAKASLRSLTERLDAAKAEGRPVRVLHLLCHGAAKGVALHGADDHSVEVVDPGGLARTLEGYASMIRLVVICACDSAKQSSLDAHLGSVAQELHRVGFPWVLASRFPLSRDGSVALTRALFRDLRGGLSTIDRAVWEARRALASSHEWATLQLYVAPPARAARRRGRVDQSRPTDIFVGRAAELERLERALLGPDETGRDARVVALYGMAGVGKSYIADRFAYEHAAKFPGGSLRIVLTEAESRTPDIILSDIAAQLDYAVDKLRERLRFPLTLVHIENVDDRARVKLAHRVATALAGCPLIMSSRVHDLGRRAGWVQAPVVPLDEELALELLVAEGCEPLDDDEREEHRRLVRALGCLPLALSLAAGYLRLDYAVDDFLDEFRDSKLSLEPMDATELTADSARAILSRSITLSWEVLARELSPRDKPLREALACLGHGPAAGVGRSLGAAVTGLEERALVRVMARAQSLSLVVPVRTRRQAWSLHPLVREFMRTLSDAGEVRARMDAWFLERLPERDAGDEARQGALWSEVQQESVALGEWLETVPVEQLTQVEQAGSSYAIQCGPFESWRRFCHRVVAACRGDDEGLSNALFTLAAVSCYAGYLDEAREAAEKKARVDQARGAERGEALAHGLIADVLFRRGELEEALRIRREEELPVYERLGDVRSRAVTMGKIADVLEARGELEEALRIRREEQLPVYERLGDVRARAVAMGRIAGVLFRRGELEEALRIRREELLPVYERLGDVRSRAVTMGWIADVLFRRGELEEALRILREELLPVFERLGDVRERAMTMGKIADVLKAQGELEEALRIRREEQLPVYERLGDKSGIAHTYYSMGQLALAVNAQDDALEMFEKAFNLNRELGRLDGIAFSGLKVGRCLVAADRHEQARGVLGVALDSFTKLGLSEQVEEVRRLLAQLPEE